jgi:hypothetical protein
VLDRRALDTWDIEEVFLFIVPLSEEFETEEGLQRECVRCAGRVI